MNDQEKIGSGGGTAVARSNVDAALLPRRGGSDDVRDRVLTTKMGLEIPVNLSFDDWERAGRQLSGIVDSSSWWLGDWLVYGKDHYVDRYQRGIRAAGLQYQTLRNYAWVARRFELSRRRETLSFQHHAELASLPLEEQEAWLDRAEQSQWSTKHLRDALRAARQGGSATAKPALSRPNQQLALPDHRIQWWHRAAEHTGARFEEWVMATLDDAAKLILADNEVPVRATA